MNRFGHLFFRRRVGAIALTLVIVVVSWQVVGYLARSQPVFAFIPACREYEYPDDTWYMGYDRFRFLSGEPTKEFWASLQKIFLKLGYEKSNYRVSKPDSTIKIPLSSFLFSTWPFDNYDGEQEKEEFFHSLSKIAADNIFSERVSANIINDNTMNEFMVVRRLSRAPAVRRHPDECGFMEELIMKGGRFAGD